MKEDEYKFLMVEIYKHFTLSSNHSPYINKDKQNNNEPCKCGSGIKYKKCCKFKR